MRRLSEEEIAGLREIVARAAPYAEPSFVERAVNELSATRAERDQAVEHLRRALDRTRHADDIAGRLEEIGAAARWLVEYDASRGA